MSDPHAPDAPGAEPDGLILAAGASRRMGRPKALLRWGGPAGASPTASSEAPQGARYLLADQVERLRRAGCRRIVCVLGAHADEIEAARAWACELDRNAASPESAEPIVIARNPQWPLGAFSSLQCGVRALRASGNGTSGHGVSGQGASGQGASGQSVILLPVDVPGVSHEIFERLIGAAGARPAPDAVVPVHGGRGGHPVWLAPATLERILQAPPDSRLDHLLRGMRVARIEVADARVALNVNTPEEWLRFAREQAPET